METEYVVEFWEQGKHVISYTVKADSTFEAIEYGLGKFADTNYELRQDAEPEMAYDEVRSLSPSRLKALGEQLGEVI